MSGGILWKKDNEPLLARAFPTGSDTDVYVFFTVAEAEAIGLNGRFGSRVFGGIVKVEEESEVGSDP